MSLVNFSGPEPGVQGVLFRPVQFVRYRKPQVVSYPRHAIVLNPYHTQQQREASHARPRDRAEAEHSDFDEETGSLNRPHDPDDDDDAEDPRRMDPTTFLCPPKEFESCFRPRWSAVGPAATGLVNLGNTCYLNAVLQALAHTPALAQYFMERFKTPNQALGAPYDFAYALGETFRHMLGARPGLRAGAPYRPSLIAARLPTLSRRFQLGTQCDAHEFLVQLLGACEKAIVFRLVGPKKLEPRVALSTALFQICGGYLRSQVAWALAEELEQLTRAGKTQAAVDLTLAGRGAGPGKGKGKGRPKLVSNTYDPTNVLHLDVVGQTLEQCLAAFCAPEPLPGRCYHTPRDVAVHATKQMTLHLPPRVLLVHLKRFHPSGAKLTRAVRYPLVLDVGPFLTPARSARARACRYDLQAVCVHQGGSITHGHYYAVARARNGIWYRCDDADVRPIDVARALQEQAYLLVYAQQTGPAPSPSPSPRPGRLSTPGRHGTAEGAVALGEAVDEAGEGRRRGWAGGAETETQTEKGGGGSKETGEAAGEGERARETSPPGTPSSASEPDEDAVIRLPGPWRRPPDRFAGPPVEGAFAPATTPSAPAAATTSATSTSKRPWVRIRTLRAPTKATHKKNNFTNTNPKNDNDNNTNTNNNNNNANEDNTTQENASASVTLEGRGAVAALQEFYQNTTPATVRRPRDAATFPQRVRDPEWEREMDRGRIKKIRSKTFAGIGMENEEKDGGGAGRQGGVERNPFQAVANRRLEEAGQLPR